MLEYPNSVSPYDHTVEIRSNRSTVLYHTKAIVPVFCFLFSSHFQPDESAVLRNHIPSHLRFSPILHVLLFVVTLYTPQVVPLPENVRPAGTPVPLGAPGGFMSKFQVSVCFVVEQKEQG